MKQTNYNLTSKITNRNPVFKSTSNFTQSTLTNKPFSRKPVNAVDKSFLRHSKVSQNQMETSINQKSILDNQSVVSGGHSAKQSKFIRTNKMEFLSPKNKKRQFQQSFSPQQIYGSQSQIMSVRNHSKQISFYQQITEQDRILSDQSSIEQSQNYMHKSISSNNLFGKNNKTRNMILSKFSQLSKKSKQKSQKKQLQTSLNVSFIENQKQLNKVLQRQNNELRQKIIKFQQEVNLFSKENQQSKKQNDFLKTQVSQLKKRVQQLLISKGNSRQQQNELKNTVSSANLNLKYPNNRDQKSSNENLKCQKCQQKQRSNQKQVTYFQNIIKKKETQLISLRRKQVNLSKLASQNQTQLSQLKNKLAEMLQNQKLIQFNQKKLQQCVNFLKQQVAKLDEQMRYLKIQNSVLLKIKNQNLKLKIDITKIQDQRDYFKMKVIQIHKKNGQNNTSKNTSQRYSKQSHNQGFKKGLTSNSMKKFYLDSTQTEQLQTTDKYMIDKKRKPNKSIEANFCKRKEQIDPYKTMKNKVQQNNNNFYNHNPDTLFDLTSEQSQNSY